MLDWLPVSKLASFEIAFNILRKASMYHRAFLTRLSKETRWNQQQNENHGPDINYFLCQNKWKNPSLLNIRLYVPVAKIYQPNGGDWAWWMKFLINEIESKQINSVDRFYNKEQTSH